MDEVTRRFIVDLHNIIDGASNAATSTFMLNSWTPAAGSIAATERAERPNGRSGLWGPEPVLTAHSFVSMTAFAAQDHLAAMARLIHTEGMTLFGVHVLARAVIEASARAFWLADPTLDSRGRVARSLAERLGSLNDANRLTRELNGDPKDIERGVQRREEILAEAVDLGVPVHRENHEGRRVPVGLKQGRPAASELIADLLTAANFRIGKGLYTFLSGIDHTLAYAIYEFFSMRPSSEAGIAEGHPELRTRVLYQAGFLTLIAFHAAFTRIVEFYGWDDVAWDSWDQHAKQKLLDLEAILPPDDEDTEADRNV